jgi:hypothetical protein
LEFVYSISFLLAMKGFLCLIISLSLLNLALGQGPTSCPEANANSYAPPHLPFKWTEAYKSDQAKDFTIDYCYFQDINGDALPVIFRLHKPTSLTFAHTTTTHHHSLSSHFSRIFTALCIDTSIGGILKHRTSIVFTTTLEKGGSFYIKSSNPIYFRVFTRVDGKCSQCSRELARLKSSSRGNVIVSHARGSWKIECWVLWKPNPPSFSKLNEGGESCSMPFKQRKESREFRADG